MWLFIVFTFQVYSFNEIGPKRILLKAQKKSRKRSLVEKQDGVVKQLMTSLTSLLMMNITKRN